MRIEQCIEMHSLRSVIAAPDNARFEFVETRHDDLVGEKRKTADTQAPRLVGGFEHRAAQQFERLPQRAEVLFTFGGERDPASLLS